MPMVTDPGEPQRPRAPTAGLINLDSWLEPALVVCATRPAEEHLALSCLRCTSVQATILLIDETGKERPLPAKHASARLQLIRVNPM